MLFFVKLSLATSVEDNLFEIYCLFRKVYTIYTVKIGSFATDYLGHRLTRFLVLCASYQSETPGSDFTFIRTLVYQY